MPRRWRSSRRWEASSGWRGRKRVRSTPSVTATTRWAGRPDSAMRVFRAFWELVRMRSARRLASLFEPGEDVEQGIGGADELMVEHLARETALVVEHQSRAMHASEEPADEHAFVQVGVNDIDGPRGQAGEGGGEQGGVEHELAPVRADARAATVEPGGDADDGLSGRVVSAGIRYNGNVVAMLLEGAGFFENANVAAVVREEAGRRDFEDMTTHDARLPYTRNLRRSGPTEAKWILGVWTGRGNGGEPGVVLQDGRYPGIWSGSTAPSPTTLTLSFPCGGCCVTRNWLPGRPLTDFRRVRRNLPLPQERGKTGVPSNRLTPSTGAPSRGRRLSGRVFEDDGRCQRGPEGAGKMGKTPVCLGASESRGRR